MRITLAAMLLLGSSAIKIQQAPHLAKFLGLKKHELCPTEEEEAEMVKSIEKIEDWTPLSKADAEAMAKKYCEEKGYEPSEEEMAEAEAEFDKVDADGNGELSAAEIMAVADDVEAKYEEKCGGGDKKEKKKPKKESFAQVALKTLSKKHKMCPTEDELKEMEGAMENVEDYTPISKKVAADVTK